MATLLELADETQPNCELAVDFASLLPGDDLLSVDAQMTNCRHLMFAAALNEMLQNERYPNEMMTAFRVNACRDVNLLMCSW
jgi:hypothetical protein